MGTSPNIDSAMNHPERWADFCLPVYPKIYAGPVNPATGEQIYTSFPAGSEASGLGLLYQQNPAAVAAQQFCHRINTLNKTVGLISLQIDSRCKQVLWLH